MDESMFNELFDSISEAGAIRRGEKEPSRVIEYDDIDVKAIRAATKLSQSKFAALLGVSVKAIQSWEQKARQPLGPARSLLIMFRNDPVQAMELLHKKA